MELRDKFAVIALQTDDNWGPHSPHVNSPALQIPQAVNVKVRFGGYARKGVLPPGWCYCAPLGPAPPPGHSALDKGLDRFKADLVRVRNYCTHKLTNEAVAQRTLKSELITGKLCELLLTS